MLLETDIYINFWWQCHSSTLSFILAHNFLCFPFCLSTLEKFDILLTRVAHYDNESQSEVGKVHIPGGKRLMDTSTGHKCCKFSFCAFISIIKNVFCHFQREKWETFLKKTALRTKVGDSQNEIFFSLKEIHIIWERHCSILKGLTLLYLSYQTNLTSIS